MHNQVQRVIESADRRDDADGLAAGKRHASLRRRVQIHWNLFTTFGSQEFNAAFYPINGSGHLSHGITQGFTSLTSRFDGQFIGTLGHDRGSFRQDVNPPTGLQPLVAVAKKTGGIGKGFIDGRAVGCLYRRKERTIVGRPDLKVPIM